MPPEVSASAVRRALVVAVLPFITLTSSGPVAQLGSSWAISGRGQSYSVVEHAATVASKRVYALGAAESQRPPAVPVVPAPTDRWAVVVGINHASGAPRLQGAVGDAVVLRDALLRYGFPAENIRVLLDGDASSAAILESIGWLARNAPSDGRAVFAFAGHTRRQGGQNRIVAAEGRTISRDQLASALGAVRAPMWATFPTCFAAGFAVPGIVGPGRVVTFGSSASARSYESPTFGQSFLFHYMVALGMLRGEAGAATVERTFEYARARLAAEYPDTEPLIDDQFAGDFTLSEDQPTLVGHAADGQGSALEPPSAPHAAAPQAPANPAPQPPQQPQQQPRPQSPQQSPPPDQPPPQNRDQSSGVCSGSVEVGKCG